MLHPSKSGRAAYQSPRPRPYIGGAGRKRVTEGSNPKRADTSLPRPHHTPSTLPKAGRHIRRGGNRHGGMWACSHPAMAATPARFQPARPLSFPLRSHTCRRQPTMSHQRDHCRRVCGSGLCVACQTGGMVKTGVTERRLASATVPAIRCRVGVERQDGFPANKTLISGPLAPLDVW